MDDWDFLARIQSLLVARCEKEGSWITVESVEMSEEESAEVSFEVTFLVDRDVANDRRGHAVARGIAADVVRDEPTLRPGCIICKVTPTRSVTDFATVVMAETAQRTLAEWCTAHVHTCPRHAPGDDREFFIHAVTPVHGWAPIEDHLLAHFCVEPYSPDVVDEICCARAIAALTSAHPATAGILWKCTRYQ